MPKRFRIGLSFAGEKRAFVANVAHGLAACVGKDRILYDRYHEAEFANADLAFDLPGLYKEQADLVVVIFCKHYETTEWCGLEWRAIYSLIKQRQARTVMLCRFDRVEPKGLNEEGGFVELDGRPVHEVVSLVLERLALNEGMHRDHYVGQAPPASASRDWPEKAPQLHWPVADHRKAQEAFAQLITRDAPFRLLPIHGVSGTGKSHLTKQFHSNVLPIPGLTCGRFDFKGSVDMENELRTFAGALDVPVPGPGRGVAEQLTDILTSLRRANAPTLLIFDTFEWAGAAERWVKESLLIALVRSPWLRVIVVGQCTTDPRGEPWAKWSLPAVELRAPTPEDWFAFGRKHKPTITLEFVRQAHALCEGKSMVLAQLFGPRA